MSNGTCEVEGCDKPLIKRRWCSAHYQRWRKYGDPLTLKHTPRGNCAIGECPKPALAKNLCATHYQRKRKFGDPLVVTQIQGDDLARFWSKVDKRGPDECWPWTAPVGEGGYCAFFYGGVQGLAHRAAYEFFVGPIPAGQTVDHACHNGTGCYESTRCEHRRCVNPAHLVIATRGENTLRGYGPAAVNARKDECVRHHPFDEANTYVSPSGKRQCRACRRERATARAA